MPIRLISTDFDGTIFAEFADPPIAQSLQQLLGGLQRRGATWVINTGRDLGSLLETLGRTQIRVHPDALVLVEREIYVRQDMQYVPLRSWNERCSEAHRELFARLAPDLPHWIDRLESRHRATLYADAYSPLCILAESTAEADAIQRELETYARGIPNLGIVRNDVSIRIAHDGYDKGTALAEIGRRLGIPASETLAAGDHYNDLPMLLPHRAQWLVAPSNAISEVQTQVRAAGGYLSNRPCGEGVAQGIEFFLEKA